MSHPIRVIVDERERPSGVPKILEGLGVKNEYRMLSIGDYIISREYAIERKNVNDFVNSLYQGRLFDQAYRLSDAYRIPILIVEGDIQAVVGESSKPRAIWGALATISFGYNLRIFFTANVYQTADLIYTVARHGRFTRPRRPIVFRRPKGGTLSEIQVLIVSGLPGVGPKLADRILSHFNSVRNFFSSSIAQLSMVEGIGRKKAEKIIKLLDAPYRPIDEISGQAKLDEGPLNNKK